MKAVPCIILVLSLLVAGCAVAKQKPDIEHREFIFLGQEEKIIKCKPDYPSVISGWDGKKKVIVNKILLMAYFSDGSVVSKTVYQHVRDISSCSYWHKS